MVDQDGASSEVHFTATGELSVSSNATGITYGVNLSPYATKVYSDAGDLFLQNQLDNLEIEKGTVATYDCVDTQLGFTNARTGECIFSNATASAAIIIGFGTEDKSGNLTHPIANGDIIEVIAPGGVVSRYTVNDNASAPAMVAVDFVSGDQTFGTGTEYSVYIYPQNSAGVSKEYVDDQDALKLNLTGGDLTGDLNTAGNIGFHEAGKGVRYYLEDKSTNFVDITRQGVNLQNLVYADNLWTLRVQDSSNANGKTLIYGDYSSGLILDKPKTTQETQQADSNDTLVSKSYVDNQIGSLPSVNLDNYLPLSGGTMTGNLLFTGGDRAIDVLNGNRLRLKALDADGSGRTFIDIQTNDSSGGEGTDAGYRLKLYHLADPTAGYHAANMRYVDTQTGLLLPKACGTITGDLTVEGVAQFASAKNSNAPVAGVDLTNKSYTDATFVKKTARPGLKFGYESGSSGVPASGKFRWYIDGGRRLRLSATTKDGIPWGVDTPIVDINFNEGHMFTIWATVSNTDNWRIKQTGTINRIDYHDNDILCYVSYHAENGTFSTSADYNITIAGLI